MRMQQAAGAAAGMGLGAVHASDARQRGAGSGWLHGKVFVGFTA